MKTQYELTFEESITAMILSNNDPSVNQLDLFMDFHRNSCTYYDIFCDGLYALSSGQSSRALWLTPSGRPYLADEQRNEGDRKLITYEQIPEFIDDLKEQLETALNFLCEFSSK